MIMYSYLPNAELGGTMRSHEFGHLDSTNLPLTLNCVNASLLPLATCPLECTRVMSIA